MINKILIRLNLMWAYMHDLIMIKLWVFLICCSSSFFVNELLGYFFYIPKNFESKTMRGGQMLACIM